MFIITDKAKASRGWESRAGVLVCHAQGFYLFRVPVLFYLLPINNREVVGQAREGRDKQGESSLSQLAFISRAGHIVHIARRGRAFAGKTLLEQRLCKFN